MRKLLSLVLASAAVAAVSAGVPVAQAVQSGPGRTEVAVFAAGCFWCTEADFDKLAGVKSTTSGYTGGRTDKPTYEQVSSGGTGHIEAVRIEFDPAVVTYEALLDHFWKNVDPFNARGQFCDIGESYKPVIFTADERQRTAATRSRDRLQMQFKERIVVEIRPAATFFRAEEYHQDYYKKNPVRYNFYRWNCGRDNRLAQVWGDH
jgi:peptide-methionine (S)-S-oxide reductase